MGVDMQALIAGLKPSVTAIARGLACELLAKNMPKEGLEAIISLSARLATARIVETEILLMLASVKAPNPFTGTVEELAGSAAAEIAAWFEAMRKAEGPK